MKLDSVVSQVYVVAVNEARLNGHEYVTPEHFLYSALMFDGGKELLSTVGGQVNAIYDDLTNYFRKYMPQNMSEVPMESQSFNQMVMESAIGAKKAGKIEVTLAWVVRAILSLEQSHASYILQKNGVNKIHVESIAQESTARTKIFTSKVKDKLLESHTLDLIEAAHANKFDPLVGRDDEILDTIHVLCRRLKNNPVHVGDPGVGKTAIVYGLASLVAKGLVPDVLQNASMLALDMPSLVAGTRYRGDFEERLVKLLAIISKLNSPIVYIDEIHTVIGTGAISGGSVDATSIIKPYLSRGDIRFIGSTTHEEYKKHFEKDRALVRRFAKIDIHEPSDEECVNILMGLKPRYEDFHGVVYTNEVLQTVVNLSKTHINDRFLPDKAIDVMDEAGVYAKLKAKADVTEKIVELIVARTAKIPEKSVGKDEKAALKNLGRDLNNKVYGQKEAIDKIVHAIYSSRAGLGDPEKPVSNLLFVGPTGVGKTEVAKQLAELLGIKLLRFDMSEYQEKHAVARLIGAPPGYVGYEEGGLLTDQIRRTPHAVLLLDEIEKAHADILNILLQVMDYGKLTDNNGKKADFSNCIIIMTSNAGAREITRKTIGFSGEADIGAMDKAVERIFSPEFRNRLDSIVSFNGINQEMALLIARKALKQLSDKLSAKGVKLTATKTVLEFIAKKGLSEIYGAREIIRFVENDVKKLLVEKVLFGELSGGGNCKLKLQGQMLHVQIFSENIAQHKKSML